MILAGIDEVGYGCILGPMVVGSCAVSLPEVTWKDDELCADVWSMLSRSVSRKKTAGRLHVADSKLVYKPAGGLGGLEAAVLCLCHGAKLDITSLEALLDAVLLRGRADVAASPWYQPVADELHPHAAEGASIGIMGNVLHDDCRRAGVAVESLAATVVTERRFNLLCGKTLNKASTLFSLTMEHLDKLVRAYHGRSLTVICDRQGGRRHYGSLLRTMFEDFSHTTLCEDETVAIYEIAQHGALTRIVFCEKAELISLPTAAASMVGKYIRERLMHRFNRYWQNHVPGLQPTAGYWTDGMRFLSDTAPARQRLKVPDADLVRSR